MCVIRSTHVLIRFLIGFSSIIKQSLISLNIRKAIKYVSYYILCYSKHLCIMLYLSRCHIIEHSELVKIRYDATESLC